MIQHINTKYENLLCLMLELIIIRYHDIDITNYDKYFLSKTLLHDEFVIAVGRFFFFVVRIHKYCVLFSSFV